MVGSDGTSKKYTKNEAGKKINYKKDKDPELYKKWMKRTHIKIQDTGEKEDKRTVENAFSFHMKRYEDRKEGKKMKNTRINSRGQIKNVDQLTKMKKKKRLEIEKRSKKRRDPNSASSMAFKNRIQGKIEARSRPTRQKLIMKKK